MSNFYCQKLCGSPSFSIEEWNEAFKHCNENNIEGEERDRILSPHKFPCTEQCFDCMAIVGQRRMETQRLLNKTSNNEH